MEYLYAAMLLHEAGQKIEEGNVKKVLDATGIEVDEARVKALVVALEGVNIEEAIKNVAVPVTAMAPIAEAKAEGKKEEKKSATEEKKSEEAVATGLRKLFGD